MDSIANVIKDRLNSVFVDSEIKPGFKDLDKIFKFKKSNFYVIASRPDSCKTILMINMALKIAESGKDVYFFTFDRCKEEIIKMMASCYTNLKKLEILTNDLNPEERELLNKALDKLSKLPIYLDDSSRDSSYIINEINKIKDSIVLIDGFEYLDISDEEIGAYKMVLNKTKYQTRCNNAYKLKKAAIRNQIPIVVTCYVPRIKPVNYDRELNLKDLDRVGSIAMEADTVMFLEHIYSTSIVKVEVKKVDFCTGDIGLYAYLKFNFMGCILEDCNPQESRLIDWNEELREKRQRESS